MIVSCFVLNKQYFENITKINYLYEKIYRLVEIFLINNYDNRKANISLIQKIMDNCVIGNHISFRMVIYVSVHCIIFYPEFSINFINTINNKLHEFKLSHGVEKYFSHDELDNYLQLMKLIVDIHDTV